MEESDPCSEPLDSGDSGGTPSGTCGSNGSNVKLERSSVSPDPSEQEYREAIRCNPNDADAHFNLGLLLAKRGALDLEEAEKQYREAIHCKPDGASAHFYLGLLFAGRGALQEAEKQYREAIRCNPDQANAHFTLGLLLAKQAALPGKLYSGDSDLKQAEKQYREAIRCNPNDADAHFDLGLVLYWLSDLEAAVHECSKAFRCSPNHAMDYNNLRLQLAEYVDSRQPGSAIRMAFNDAASKRFDVSSQAFGIVPTFGACGSYAKLDRSSMSPDPSEQECREALRCNPSDADAHFNLGLLLVKRGALDLEEAENQYREAIRCNPDDANAHFNLGLLFAGCGALEEAEKRYREAIRCNPDDANAHFTLALLLARRAALPGNLVGGERDLLQAEKHYREAIRCSPNDADAHFDLGLVLYELSPFEAWLSHLEAAVHECSKAFRCSADHAKDYHNLRFQLAEYVDPRQVGLAFLSAFNHAASKRFGVSPRAFGTLPTPDPHKPHLYSVWYATNRELIDPSATDRIYGSSRSERDVVYYGFCTVSIPKFHEIGSTGSSWWKRLLTFHDDRLKVQYHSVLNEVDYWEKIQGKLGCLEQKERMALVYIHGYNVTFEGAAIRAAQLGVDLQIPLTAFYSWPSMGAVSGYAADVASIEASEDLITEFLIRFIEQSGAESVHLIAHSMGNRAVLRSLQTIAQRAAISSKIPFGQIFFAAPDVDAGVFRNLAKICGTVAQHTTLYVSSKDQALAGSGALHYHPRAGHVPPVTVVPGIDTIEVSNVDLSLLGHGYFGEVRELLQDIYVLISDGKPPPRFGLVSTQAPDGNQYWRIGK
jgi:esterase/lipase superfamily enzyme/tetratricopeptide (TPR) repeat protein